MENTQKNDHAVAENDHAETTIHYPGWKVMPFVIGNETLEKLGAIGTLINLLIYLTTVFNMKTITAAKLLNVFNGSSNLATLIGAFLSDTYFGRYKTLIFATLSSLSGLIVMYLTAAVRNLHPPHCTENSCKEATAAQMAVLLTGFGLILVGSGGIRPCSLAFAADQFNPRTESGKKEMKSFFNWYFFIFNFTMMVFLAVITYVQTNISWVLGLGIPPILTLISLLLFFGGSKMYVKVKATGSPMTSVAQVIVVAIKKRKLKQPEQPWISLFNYKSSTSINSKLCYSHQFRFLDKAAVLTAEDGIKDEGSVVDPWKVCSMQQVEEVKCLIRVMPIWMAGILYSVSQGLMQQTYTLFQALQSDRRFGRSGFKIPAASYNTVFPTLALTLWLPFYDRILVPVLQRRKQGGITLLQRQGIGYFVGIVSTVVAAVVEKRRRTIAVSKPTLGIEPQKGAVSSMSAMWLIPQLSLGGLSEAFAGVSQMEFYYQQFPENMRSIATSVGFCSIAIASYLNGLIITIVHSITGSDGKIDWLPQDLNKGRLDYFYYFLTALGILNLGYFLVCAKWYKYYKGTTDQTSSDIGLIPIQSAENL